MTRSGMTPKLTLSLPDRLEIGAQNQITGQILNQHASKSNARMHFTHNKLIPRYYESSHHKRRKPFLEKAKERISECYSDRLKFDIASLFYHQDKIKKSGGYRKVRSEQVEAMTTRIGRCIIHHVNLATMSLGHFVNGVVGFHYYGLDYIAKEVGANLSQVKRTIARFISAGYLLISQRKLKKADGTFKSQTPIIRVNPRLFYDLGFDHETIKFHVERAEKSLDKIKEKASQKIFHKPALFEKKSVGSSFKKSRRTLAEIMLSLSMKLIPNSS